MVHHNALSLKHSGMAHVQQGVHTVLPATHRRIQPAFASQPQVVTAVWSVLIVPTHEGMAMLS